MKQGWMTMMVAAALLAAGVGETFAADRKADAATRASSGTVAASSAGASGKAPAPTSLVDINSASRKELKTLPGITDAEAGKIVAGRPYGSKAHLVTRGILDAAAYDAVKSSIVARQPDKAASKSASVETKKP
jgi:DNA uptake protein ComE-like DNA-binding protein